MPTYNDARYIRDAVDSILAQTFTDFELVVVNDGSTDDTLDILAEYDDSRIRVVSHEKNLGRPYARNTALDVAKGEYVAWMDADDISLPTRLEKQVAFMDAHPDIAVCGSAIQCFHGSDKRFLFPRKTQAITVGLFSTPTIPNPASCIRRSALERFAVRYNVDLPRAQDYEFWCRMLLDCGLKGANLPDTLFLYRVRILVYSESHKDVLRLILKRLGVEPDDERLGTYLEFVSATDKEDLSHSLEDYLAFVVSVLHANAQTGVFEQASLKGYLYFRLGFLISLLEHSLFARGSRCLRVLGIGQTVRGAAIFGARRLLKKIQVQINGLV